MIDIAIGSKKTIGNLIMQTYKLHNTAALHSIWMAVVILLLCSVPLNGWVQDDEVEKASSEEVTSASSGFFTSTKLSGSMHSSYQFRENGGVDDHDFTHYMSLYAKDVWKDRIDVGMSLLWHQDLDGEGSTRRDMFLDLDQANNNDVRFFTGYADVKDLIFDDSRLRLGRQYFEEIDHAHFDGAAYQFEPVDRLDLSIFGGRPVSFYSSNDGEAIYGLNAEYQFTPQTKAAARYYRYDGDGFQNDLGAVEIWHMFTPNLQSHVEFSLLDAEPYILQTDLLSRVDSWDLDTSFQLIHLFETISDHTINFNPVFPLLNSYEPFTRGSVHTVKGMGQYFSLTAGIDVREADSTNPVVDNTNRDYRRFSAGAEFYPLEKLTISISGEYWDVDPNDEFTGITGEIEYEPTPQWTLTAGMDYGEYVQEYRDEFLFFFGNTNVFKVSPDVITYYGRVRYKPNQKVYSSVLLEVEDNDIDQDEYYTVRLEIGVRF